MSKHFNFHSEWWWAEDKMGGSFRSAMLNERTEREVEEDSRIRNLAAAIILRAARDAYSTSRGQRKKTRDWLNAKLTGADERKGATFHWCCEVLDLCPDQVRERIIKTRLSVLKQLEGVDCLYKRGYILAAMFKSGRVPDLAKAS
jgi:hypothetical protein